ncbi:hypothetical protein V8F33_011844 [Rhypophila sp. PSN 637]
MTGRTSLGGSFTGTRIESITGMESMDSCPPGADLKPDTSNGALIPYSMTITVIMVKVLNQQLCYNGMTKWGSYVDIAACAGEEGDDFGFNKDPYILQANPVCVCLPSSLCHLVPVYC